MGYPAAAGNPSTCPASAVSVCNGPTLNGTSGYIRSTNLAVAATKAYTCQTTITVPQGYVVQIAFSYFDVPPSNYFIAYDVAQDITMATPTITQMVSYQLRALITMKITSMNNQTLIDYIANNLVGTGFCLHWTAIPQSAYTIGTPYGVNIPTNPPLVSLIGTMTDPSGGTGLNKMSDTRTLMQCPTNYTISVAFNFFCAIQSSEFYNFVVFYDGPFPATWSASNYRDNTQLSQYFLTNFSGCPNQVGGQPVLPPAEFKSTSNQIVVNFATEQQPSSPFTQAFSFNFSCQPVPTPPAVCPCCPYYNWSMGAIYSPPPQPCYCLVSCDAPQVPTCSDFGLFGASYAPSDTPLTLQSYLNPMWHYPAGLDCTMTITAPLHYVIQVVWTHFDLTTSQGDKLYVWDQFTYNDGTIWLNDLYAPYSPYGPYSQYSNSSFLQGPISAVQSNNYTVTTYNPTLRIRFVTNTNGGTGFAFKFTAISRPTYTAAGPLSLTALPIVAQDGTCTSVNYPSSYPMQNARAFFSAPPGLYYSITMTYLNLLPHDTLTIYQGPFSDATQLNTDGYLSQYEHVAYTGTSFSSGCLGDIYASQFVVELNPTDTSTGSNYSFSFYYNVYDPSTNFAYQNEASNILRSTTSTQGTTTTQASSGGNNNSMYALVSLVALPVLLLAAAVVIVKRRKMQQQKADQQFYDPRARIPSTKLAGRIPSDMESPEFCPVTHDMACSEDCPGCPPTPLSCARAAHATGSDPRLRAEM
jgi:hypothetical protein